MIHLTLTEIGLECDRILYTITWIYDGTISTEQVEEWCYQTYGDAAGDELIYTDFEYHMWVDYIQWGEVSFTNKDMANWFLLKWG